MMNLSKDVADKVLLTTSEDYEDKGITYELVSVNHEGGAAVTFKLGEVIETYYANPIDIGTDMPQIEVMKIRRSKDEEEVTPIASILEYEVGIFKQEQSDIVASFLATSVDSFILDDNAKYQRFEDYVKHYEEFENISFTESFTMLELEYIKAQLFKEFTAVILGEVKQGNMTAFDGLEELCTIYDKFVMTDLQIENEGVEQSFFPARNHLEDIIDSL